MARIDLKKTVSASTAAFQRIADYNPVTIHKKGQRVKAFFALGLVCFLWGTTWIASKEGVRYMPALQLSGMRQLLGGLTYVIYFMYKKKPFPKGKEWYPILLLSLFNFILSNGLATWGVKYISAGLGSIIGAIVPLWVVLIGIFIGKKLNLQTILGMVLGFGGICVVFYEHLMDFMNPDFTFGIIISVLGTLTWAIGSLFTKKQASNFNPYFSIGLQMTIAGVALLSAAGFTGNTLPLAEIPLHSWVALAFLIFFGSIVAFRAYIFSLQRLPAEQASIYAYINPIVAVIFGALIFNEKLTPFLIAGGLVTLLGVYIVNNSYKKPLSPKTSSFKA